MIMLLFTLFSQYDAYYYYDYETINQYILGKVKGNEVNNIKIIKNVNKVRPRTGHEDPD